jgi:uncharacterized protein (TIGR02145 family)
MANKIIYINNKKAVLNGAWLMEDPGLRELILSTDGNGTLTATKTMGYPNETSLLTPTPNNLYVFDRYELSGAGSIQDNTYTFGNENASIKAFFKDSDEVTIGTQTWKRYNLAISDGGNGIYIHNCGVVNGVDLGTQYYYTSNAAKRIVSANYPGWHVPTKSEFDTLFNYIGTSVAGKKLKTTSGWNNNGNGTDDYGFRAFPCGSYNYDQNVWLNIGGVCRFYASDGYYATNFTNTSDGFTWGYLGTIVCNIRLIKD